MGIGVVGSSLEGIPLVEGCVNRSCCGFVFGVQDGDPEGVVRGGDRCLEFLSQGAEAGEAVEGGPEAEPEAEDGVYGRNR